MTFQKMASMIASHEGKRISLSIGNIREVLAIIIDLNAQTGGEFSRFLAAESSKKNIVGKRTKALQKRLEKASKIKEKVDSTDEAAKL